MSYKLYFLDRTGHIDSLVGLVCDDDEEAVEEAVEAAAERPETRNMELWCGARLIRRLPGRFIS